MRVPWWVLVALAVGGFLAGAFLADSRNAEARGRAEEAERQADELREKVHADSIRMAGMWAEYQAEREARLAETAALAEAEARADAEARARRSDRVAFTARSDSMARLLSDTATVVPRPTYDAARQALAAAVAEAEALGRQVVAVTDDRDSWRLLWARADSGWTAGLEQVAGLNGALAAQVRATDAWRKAAKPTWGVRVLRALPPLAVGGALCYVFCPKR